MGGQWGNWVGSVANVVAVHLLGAARSAQWACFRYSAAERARVGRSWRSLVKAASVWNPALSSAAQVQNYPIDYLHHKALSALGSSITQPAALMQVQAQKTCCCTSLDPHTHTYTTATTTSK